jgi:hypothetical protein
MKLPLLLLLDENVILNSYFVTEIVYGASNQHVIGSEGEKYYTNLMIKHFSIHAEDSYTNLKFV